MEKKKVSYSICTWLNAVDLFVITFSGLVGWPLQDGAILCVGVEEIERNIKLRGPQFDVSSPAYLSNGGLHEIGGKEITEKGNGNGSVNR